MVVEKLGGRQGVRLEDGSEPGHHLRGREEAEEEAAHRLHVLQPETSQFLGIQILLL